MAAPHQPSTGPKGPSHRLVGDALGYNGDVVMQRLRCTSCQHVQTEPLDACANAREAIAGVTCGCCGMVGRMRMVRG